ncbi:MAG: DNA-3-methyladenine glycosylase [Candidatus Melainabacteria bacterium]
MVDRCPPIVSQPALEADSSVDGPLPLGRAFFERDTCAVARDLLGQYLVAATPPGHPYFVVVETEAYAEGDAACHAARYTAETARGRSAIMFGPPGQAYVYLIYGMHHCLNVVTEVAGRAGAVLIRALAPADCAGERPGRHMPLLTHGPGRLTRALGITRDAHNGLDLTDPLSAFWFAAGRHVPDEAVVQTTRIGIRQATDYPWRFYVRESPWVSVKP